MNVREKSDLKLSKSENLRFGVHMFVFQDQSHFTCLFLSLELLLSQAVYHVDRALSTDSPGLEEK